MGLGEEVEVGELCFNRSEGLLGGVEAFAAGDDEFAAAERRTTTSGSSSL